MSTYSRKPSFVYGFHGLDKHVAIDILHNQKSFKLSDNNYDWLGQGVYFWENNHERAKQYAVETSKRKDSTVKEPFVLGAVLDLGVCMDLLDQSYLDFLHEAYKLMVADYQANNIPLPENTSFGSKDFDFKNRKLDCAVINYAHQFANVDFDSVRSAFWEGNRLYPNAGFHRQNHIQIAIKNLDCIKGVFLPKGVTL